MAVIILFGIVYPGATRLAEHRVFLTGLHILRYLVPYNTLRLPDRILRLKVLDILRQTSITVKSLRSECNRYSYCSSWSIARVL